MLFNWSERKKFKDKFLKMAIKVLKPKKNFFSYQTGTVTHSYEFI